ncbi:hypothetical protein pipiens_015097 [Culex pipiens pipiens]|uniref:Uncharacterized protein n=1 Tax=Culex pipiens pipiens TaxID=38569 RepID=A0ABD1CRV8_CULPP
MAERGLTKTLPLVLPAMQVNCLDDHGLTPLHYAAATDQRTVIELLIGAGSTVDAADKHGSTPLLRAVSKGHMECFELLRRHGANVELLKRFRNSNYDNESMLHITAEKGLLEMTKMLVEEYHLGVDYQDKDGLQFFPHFTCSDRIFLPSVPSPYSGRSRSRSRVLQSP